MITRDCEELRNLGAGNIHLYEPLSRFCLRVFLEPKEDGEMAVHCPALPGVWTQGTDEGEALRNITEALQGAIEEYLDSGVSIPWQEEQGQSPGRISRWVWVDVKRSASNHR